MELLRVVESAILADIAPDDVVVWRTGLGCEDWLRLAEDVAPEVAWDVAEDGLGNCVLIASGRRPSGQAVHLSLLVGDPQNAQLPESADAVRALAEDVKAQLAA